MTTSGKNVYKWGRVDICTASEHCAGSMVTWQSVSRGLEECLAFFTLTQAQVSVHYCSKSYSWLYLIDISISLMNTHSIKCQDWPQIEYEAPFASAWEGEEGFQGGGGHGEDNYQGSRTLSSAEMTPDAPLLLVLSACLSLGLFAGRISKSHWFWMPEAPFSSGTSPCCWNKAVRQQVGWKPPVWLKESFPPLTPARQPCQVWTPKSYKSSTNCPNWTGFRAPSNRVSF